MHKHPRIPDRATIDRHVIKMQELCQRMDKHLADLEPLNIRLAAQKQKSNQ